MDRFEFKFYDWEEKTPDQPLLKQPFGDRWETYTWKEVGQMARKLATGLKSLGLPPKSHIGLISKNCREWVIADIAIIMAGYVSVPFYATLTSSQLNEVIRLGDVELLFVGKVENWEETQKGVPKEIPTISFPHYEGNSKVEATYQWDDFINKFEPIEGKPSPALSDTWTIVFTSGTTGTPKGVVQTFKQLHSTRVPTETDNVLDISLEGDNRFFSFLPLNHIAERIIVESGCLTFGGSISFSESLATFAKNLQDTRPTVFFAVPRIWTKFQQGVLNKMPQKKLDRLLKIPIVSGIIKNKLKAGLGLDKCRCNLSGAAPMTESQKEWYRKIGLGVAEGYGMTENCAITTFLKATDIKPGSVGQAQATVEIKIEEGSGQILMKAPFLMTGYYKDPEKSAEVLKGGWLHTGDQGHLDEDGYLFITGRVKDTFKTAKGKFILPAKIESKFGDNTDIEQSCVVGLGCPQPLMLVVPSEAALTKSQEDLQKSFSQSLLQVNAQLPNYQKISTIVIVDQIWSVENGLLTPTLKVKRNILTKKYQSKLMEWHDAEDTVIIEQ